MLRVYQAQDFQFECNCMDNVWDMDLEYYDTHAYCTEHGQWWFTYTPDEGVTNWRRISAFEVPYVIQQSENFRLVKGC